MENFLKMIGWVVDVRGIRSLELSVFTSQSLFHKHYEEKSKLKNY